MKQIIKYLNDNKKSCLLGINTFEDGNTRVVLPCAITTFDMEVEDDEIIFVKTWKQDDRILFSTIKKSVYEGA